MTESGSGPTTAPVVFVGPTLAADHPALVGLDTRPPVQAGDVCRAVDDGATCILIIDGCFHQVPSVRHVEILQALSRGVQVVGSASMGALRAAELWPFGMRGVGRVYRAFHEGVLTQDDEVAVAHTDAEYGYRSTSVAMVNIRHSVARAVAGNLISDETATAVLRAAKQLPYQERHWAPALHTARVHGAPTQELDRLAAFIADDEVDLKREDALLSLTFLHVPGAPRHVPAALPPFEPTVFWSGVVTEAQLRRRGADG